MCQALGEALFEEVLFDAKGNVVNDNLGDYKIPTFQDVPELSAVPVESYEPNGPFGAKEAGEGCILPIIPAILNAVFDACGVMIMDLPITSEKILTALKAKKTGDINSGIYKPSAYGDKVLELAAKVSLLAQR